MKFILPIFLVLLFSACATKIPVATKYKISTSTDLTQAKSSKGGMCKSKSLKVMQSFSSSMLMSSEMHYVVDSNKVYPYSAAQWAITPNRTISDEYYKMLRDLDIFASVGNSKSRTRSSWMLETRLEDFMQYYENDNRASYVKVSINVSLLDSLNSDVIATKVFKVKLPVNTLDANGGVLALNKALEDVLLQSASWFSEECK